MYKLLGRKSSLQGVVALDRCSPQESTETFWLTKYRGTEGCQAHRAGGLHCGCAALDGKTNPF